MRNKSLKIKLVLGGYAQGKLDYVLKKYRLDESVVWDGSGLDSPPVGDTIVINHFHCWVKRKIEGGGCPEQEIGTLLASCKECIIICDEIGNGIVPMDASKREYRERLGNILIRLAEQAEVVERVLCGIGQRIK